MLDPNIDTTRSAVAELIIRNAHVDNQPLFSSVMAQPTHDADLATENIISRSTLQSLIMTYAFYAHMTQLLHRNKFWSWLYENAGLVLSGAIIEYSFQGIGSVVDTKRAAADELAAELSQGEKIFHEEIATIFDKVLTTRIKENRRE